MHCSHKANILINFTGKKIILKYGCFNPLNAELNPICHLLTLLGAHRIFHVSGLRVKGDIHFWSEAS